MDELLFDIVFLKVLVTLLIFAVAYCAFQLWRQQTLIDELIERMNRRE